MGQGEVGGRHPKGESTWQVLHSAVESLGWHCGCYFLLFLHKGASKMLPLIHLLLYR